MKTIELDLVRRAAFQDIVNRRPGFSCQGQLGEFLDDYLVAESLLRRLIIYYASDTGRKVSEKLQTVQIVAAMSHFNLAFHRSDVTDAFEGGPGKRGFKSARQLRNGFLHDLSPEDKEEIIDKFSLVREVIGRVISPLLALEREDAGSH